jgi:hypothetical protein
LYSLLLYIIYIVCIKFCSMKEKEEDKSVEKYNFHILPSDFFHFFILLMLRYFSLREDMGKTRENFQDKRFFEVEKCVFFLIFLLVFLFYTSRGAEFQMNFL